MTIPLLNVSDLEVAYPTRHGRLHAVDRASFTLQKGETLGLVGESGCGKSSLGKAIMRLLEPAGGKIALDGVDITHLGVAALRPHRRRFQMVFQDPGGSLDPRLRVGQSLEDPLRLYGLGDAAERRERVLALLQQVGLPANAATRFAHEFSGGQRQRIAIARALALDPDLVVCDEPVSALDVSLQAQVLNLLADLQQARGVAYLFISHDLSVVQHLADRVAVMYLGQIVELAPRAELWRRPAHPYTQALIDAVPVMDPRRSRIADKQPLQGDLPNPFQPPQGCRFHTRCPHVLPRCRSEAPALRSVSPGHLAACHLHSDAGVQPLRFVPPPSRTEPVSA
ncbi:oligopeptide/dipeptide ABC transporter ATP-binding protein [Acidovorax sp. CCYZU-2555]|uniref:ABC transporter ATP-binding protein n=1 Tax=Acidovorax sp. CCYZU-2555 TaxID=2835042 RepID=UPI001BCC0E00|nr:oligopeptide/dipeptide ABC transporter ATP-binding protein [Acidovorax sp. CCYZU-2555]MBS7780524.1 ATP-binding cassette domain-containing protein [Acidovorax sp. CCYZU-2555]